LRYTEFQFKNFKGIEDMSLKLTGPVTTLVGLNESGKTTILEAIFCFSYGAEDLEIINPEMASLRVPDQWIPISKRANFNDPIQIIAVVELSEDDKKALRDHMRDAFGLVLDDVQDVVEITENYEFANSRFQARHWFWSLVVAGTKPPQRKPRRYDGKSDEWQGAVAFLIERLPRIWYFPNFLFELPERFALYEDEDGIDPSEADRGRFYRSTFEQIAARIGAGTNLQTHVIDRLDSPERADGRSLSALLLGMGKVITDTVFGGWSRIFGSEPTAQEVQIEAITDEEKPYLELKIKGVDGYYDLSERSLGFRWFFMFLLMTSFHGLESGEGRKSLFLLDEPASNLHSTAQAELLKSFDTLIEQCDLVYSTHSHHLIDVRWLDSAYIVKNAALDSLDMNEYISLRVGANTAISATPYRQFSTEHPDQTSYFQPILDLLDYRPSVLEPIPDVVLVEGKSDFYLLRYARDVLGIGADVKLVPSTGAGSLGPLIQLHVGWGKTFFVLLDGDKAGVEEKERYEDEFGPVVSGKCLLLPEIVEDETVKEVEEVLEAGDRQLIIDAIYSSSKQAPKPKKALRNAVIELYAKGEALSLSTTSSERLDLILDRLQELLESQQM
jgi:predicted ATP-dependent endonuclease of OLD family